MMIWRFVILGLLSAWAGAMLFFGVAVAPAAFAALPTRELAGGVVGRVLLRLNLAGMAVACLAAVSAVAQAALRRGAGSWALRLGLALLAVALLAGSLRVSHRMEALRAEMGGIDRVAEDHPLRVAFGRMHRLSVRLHAGALLLAIALFCLEAREVARLQP